MMSSFLRWWQWHGVSMPARAYISFSQYSASSARFTSTSPYRRQSPRPKSVTSQRGSGGRAQQWSRKQASAARKRPLISLRLILLLPVVVYELQERVGLERGAADERA